MGRTNQGKGSIIERPLQSGAITYQAMVKIPGQKAAVRSFDNREHAQQFIDDVQSQRKTVAAAWKAKWITPLTPGERADRNQELWTNEYLQTALKLYYQSDRITNRFKHPMRTILDFGGDKKLGELDRKWVRDYIKFARTQMTRTRQPYKWASIADHMKIVSAAMQWRAEELEAPGAKLPFSVRMLPRDWEVKRNRRLEPDEELAIVSRLRVSRRDTRPHLLRLMKLALNTAARLQELVLAEWKEFDLERRTWIIPAHHTKCRTARLVPLNKAAMRALKVMALIRSDSPRVFHALKSSKVVSSRFSQVIRGLGIKDLRAHDFRHEAISRIVLRQRHLSVFEIMNIVGHSSIEMLKRYTNLRGEELSAKLVD